MLAESLFYILVSNLEKFDGTEALTERGLCTKYKGKTEWGFVPIHTEEQWEEVFMMLVDAVESEKNYALDRFLVHIECPALALRE